MGVNAVTWVWKSSRAKGSELLVLLKIADWTDEDGRNSWGSVVKIAEMCRMTDRAVRDILKRLVDLGELVIEKNTEGRRVRKGHRPRAFMHLTFCDCQPEDSSGLPVPTNRKNLPVDPEDSSGLGDSQTGKDFRANRKLTRTEPEAGRTHIRKIRQGSVKEHSRARDGRRPHPLDEVVVLSSEQLALFDELASIYPNVGPSQLALDEWRALMPSLDQARFIVAHVRMRLAAGWVKDGKRFAPYLHRFIEQRRWQERAASTNTPVESSAARDGMFTVGLCSGCGETLEGVWRTGRQHLRPCPKCAPQEAVS
jgi:hypothetical protein